MTLNYWVFFPGLYFLSVKGKRLSRWQEHLVPKCHLNPEVCCSHPQKPVLSQAGVALSSLAGRHTLLALAITALIPPCLFPSSPFFTSCWTINSCGIKVTSARLVPDLRSLPAVTQWPHLPVPQHPKLHKHKRHLFLTGLIPIFLWSVQCSLAVTTQTPGFSLDSGIPILVLPWILFPKGTLW